MIRIDCVIGVINEELPPLPLFTTDAQGRIGDVFRQASRGDIDLAMHPGVLIPNPAPRTYSVTALDLHVTLARLIGVATTRPVTRIGLLIATFYRHFERALGIMFDRGMPTVDDPNPAAEFTSVPREGCAVFIGAVSQLRQAPPAIDTEAQFTAIHELGHVFNLPHTVDHLTFMSPSSPRGPYDPAQVMFDPAQCNWLAHCSTSPAVAPGGAPFGQLGPGGPLDPYGHFDSLAKIGAASPTEFGLQLTIEMKRREFWQFESVNLDVRLSVMPGISRRFRVPHMIDPGYSAFSIFIRDPRGERRRYRSCLRYCPHAQRLTITPDRSFERDIPIFIDATGYTFRTAGIHHIQVEYLIGPGRTLKSNVLEVNVLAEATKDSQRDAARDRLTRNRARLVMFHHQDFRDGRGMKQLSDYLEDVNRLATLEAGVRYAFGRACLTEPAGRHTPWPTKMRARGQDELKRALDSGGLSNHRIKIATECLDQGIHG